MSFEVSSTVPPSIRPPVAPRVTEISSAARPDGVPAPSFSAVLASAQASLAPATAAAAPVPTLGSGAPAPPAGASPPPPAAGATAGTYSNLTGDLDASPEILTRLDRMAAARGETWTVTSGLRTDAEQAELWANRASNPYPVARPGTSVHRTARAADVTIGGRAIQDVIPAEELRAAGLEPLVGDAVHVQLAGTRG